MSIALKMYPKGDHTVKLIIRTFVFSLLVTGAYASNHINNNSAKTVLVGQTSAMPVAVCPPNDPDACGVR